MSPITPYANEADFLQIGELTIENRLDQVALYGSVQLTKDKVGLQHARDLKAIIDAVIVTLEADKNLLDRIPLNSTDQVDNPFK